MGIQNHREQLQKVKCLEDANESCILICHKFEKNDQRKHAITLAVRNEAELKAHTDHGDTLGVCQDHPQRGDQDVCESRHHRCHWKMDQQGKRHRRCHKHRKKEHRHHFRF